MSWSSSCWGRIPFYDTARSSWAWDSAAQIYRVGCGGEAAGWVGAGLGMHPGQLLGGWARMAVGREVVGRGVTGGEGRCIAGGSLGVVQVLAYFSGCDVNVMAGGLVGRGVMPMVSGVRWDDLGAEHHDLGGLGSLLGAGLHGGCVGHGGVGLVSGEVLEGDALYVDGVVLVCVHALGLSAGPVLVGAWP
jgi:hypothetical protein